MESLLPGICMALASDNTYSNPTVQLKAIDPEQLSEIWTRQRGPPTLVTWTHCSSPLIPPINQAFAINIFTSVMFEIPAI